MSVQRARRRRRKDQGSTSSDGLLVSAAEDAPQDPAATPVGSGFSVQISCNAWIGIVGVLVVVIVGLAVFWPSREPFGRLVELLQPVLGMAR